MTPHLSWKTAAKIAWREGRASSVKFFFVILAVAAGVGALTGVRGFAASFRQLLLKEARTLMATARMTKKNLTLEARPSRQAILAAVFQERCGVMRPP